MSIGSVNYFSTISFLLRKIVQNKTRSHQLLSTKKLFINRNALPRYNFQWEKSYQTKSCINLGETNIVKSPWKELVIPSNVSLPEFVWEVGLTRHATKTALIDGVTGHSYTYKEAHADSKRFSILLQDLSIEKGDVVALFMPNCPEYIICLLGTMGIGAIATTINPNYTAHEVAKQFEASNTKFIVTTQTLTNVVKEAIKIIDTEIKIIVMGADKERNASEYYVYDDLMRRIQDDRLHEFAFHKDNWDDVALLPYSSGTTGLPKGVMLSTKNLVSNIYQNVYCREIEFVKQATVNYQAKLIGVLPMFHIFGLAVSSLPTLRAGGQLITIPKFEPALFAETLKRFKPTFLHLVPPLVSFCASNEDVTANHLESVEHIMVKL